MADLGIARASRLVSDSDRAIRAYESFLAREENGTRNDVRKELGHALRETGGTRNRSKLYIQGPHDRTGRPRPALGRRGGPGPSQSGCPGPPVHRPPAPPRCVQPGLPPQGGSAPSAGRASRGCAAGPSTGGRERARGPARLFRGRRGAPLAGRLRGRDLLLPQGPRGRPPEPSREGRHGRDPRAGGSVLGGRPDHRPVAQGGPERRGRLEGTGGRVARARAARPRSSIL